MLRAFKRCNLVKYLFLPAIFWAYNAEGFVTKNNPIFRAPSRPSYLVGKDYTDRKTYEDLIENSDPLTLFTVEVPEQSVTPGTTTPYACWVNLTYIADVHDPIDDSLIKTSQCNMSLLFYVNDEDFYCTMLKRNQSTFDNQTETFSDEPVVRFIEPVFDDSSRLISVKVENSNGNDVFTGDPFTTIGTLKNQFAYINVSHNGPISDLNEIDTLITYENPVIFTDENPTLEGHYLTYQFVKTDDPLVIVEDDVTAITQNIILEDFSPNYVSLGTDSDLIFGDQTTIEFNDNQELNYTWTFAGNCTINGNGYTLTLGDLGNIRLEDPSSLLTFNNIILKGISNTNIRCIDNSGSLSFRLTKIILNNDFNFDTGSFSILDQCTISGGNSFKYLTDQQSIINNDSCLCIERNSMFYYAPPIADSSLLTMASDSATLKLSGASLSVTTTGLNLANGTVIIKNKCPFYNDGATSLSQAITLGSVDILPGGSIDLRSGIINYAG